MNRLESIKNNMASCTDWYVDNAEFLVDMEYLLQRLERYETALKEVKVSTSHNHAIYVADKALKE